MLIAAAALALSACSRNHSSPNADKPSIAATVSASHSASVADKEAESLACFGWVKYDKARQGAGPSPDVALGAALAQQQAGRVKDPRWSAVATMPYKKAMTTLAGLCAEIGYHE
ncbi:hypothetical protein [Actinoallomurus sp. NPDC052274]|uniref:hypothetical protein n=1 Tax=Actinoallomurus sp. NPDC052274 TaxID=3155420 RepID=UPI00341C9D8B